MNHTARMMDEGKLSMKDYNYPIAQVYRYQQVAKLKGAETTGRMTVEYAIVIRCEFIPEGCQTGPVKDIYFKICHLYTSDAADE